MTRLDEVAEATDDGSGPRRASIWPAVEERVLDLIGAPVHDRVHQLAPRRRAAVRPAQRAGRRAPAACRAAGAGAGTPAEIMAQAGAATGAPPVIARAHHGSVSREERKHIEEALKSGQLPAVVATLQPRAGHRHGRGRPGGAGRGAAERWRPGCSGSAGPGTRSARCRAAWSSPSTAATCSPARWWPSGCATARIEELRYPRNPLDVLAQQIVAMVAMEPWPVGDLAAAGPPGRAVRRAARLGAARGAGHALRALSVDRVRRAAAARWSGTGRPTCSPRRPGRAAARRHQRRHHPRPRPVRRLPGRRRDGGRGSASSTRRWSTSRGSATCSCSARPRGGSRTSRPTGCWSPPRPGAPARMPFWKGDAAGPPGRAGPGDRRPAARR